MVRMTVVPVAARTGKPRRQDRARNGGLMAGCGSRAPLALGCDRDGLPTVGPGQRFLKEEVREVSAPDAPHLPRVGGGDVA